MLIEFKMWHYANYNYILKLKLIIKRNLLILKKKYFKGLKKFYGIIFCKENYNIIISFCKDFLLFYLEGAYIDI